TPVSPAAAVVIPVLPPSGQVVCAPPTPGFVPGVCVPVAIVVSTIPPLPAGCVPTISGSTVGCVSTTSGVGVSTTSGVATSTTRAFSAPPVTSFVNGQLQAASIATIGGEFVFPALMTAPGVATSITVGNASASSQAIRVDVFRSDGDLI